VVGYGPFSLCVTHKEGLCSSSGDINVLMIMIAVISDGPHSNDIAVVLISRSGSGVQFNSHVRPICLPEANSDISGKWCAVSGWGYQAGRLFDLHLYT
jgi:hypothetical protein